VDEICQLNFLVGEQFADAALGVAERCSRSIEEVDLIGSHGQTIYHSPSTYARGKTSEKDSGADTTVPPEAGAPGPSPGPSDDIVNSTLQIGEAAVIASRTGVTTVADFRTADMAEGGIGAPLSPYAHLLLFKHLNRPLAVQNIGGIGNLTVIPARGGPSSILAFDTGPGNMVIDALVEEITGGKMSCDEDGTLSSGGSVNEKLLETFLEHPYFELPPPKASGREMFGADYAKTLIQKGREMGAADNDLVATAVALTAHSIATSYRQHVLPEHPVKEVLLCGGGAMNPTLVTMLSELLQPIRIGKTDDYGVPSDYLEAMAFALLANETLRGVPTNLPSVTGARRPVVLGKIVPGNNFRSLVQAGRLTPGG
jgi:anhydro-N-acetylmuramic acid kinase